MIARFHGQAVPVKARSARGLLRDRDRGSDTFRKWDDTFDGRKRLKPEIPVYNSRLDVSRLTWTDILRKHRGNEA